MQTAGPVLIVQGLVCGALAGAAGVAVLAAVCHAARILLPHALRRWAGGTDRAPTREEQCRRFLEAVFEKPFPRRRPRFLRSATTGRCLELDCYCEELGLAVEVNGPQHYVFVPHFHRTREDLHAQRARDAAKAEGCLRAGVELVVVPDKIPGWEGALGLRGHTPSLAFLAAELARRGRLGPVQGLRAALEVLLSASP